MAGVRLPFPPSLKEKLTQPKHTQTDWRGDTFNPCNVITTPGISIFSIKIYLAKMKAKAKMKDI